MVALVDKNIIYLIEINLLQFKDLHSYWVDIGLILERLISEEVYFS
jgi:hypothetical protein